MTEEVEWWDYDDAAEMADAVAGDVQFVIESALDARGSAVIALSGGKTPIPIYDKLAKAKLDWKKVTIVPVDERIVPLGDPLSNVTMIGKAFIPKGARVIPVVPSATADYKAAGRSADALMQDLHWPLDLVLLGVGGDGHTASIFPGPDYDEALNGPRERRALGVMPDPLPPEVYAELLRSSDQELVFVHLAGEKDLLADRLAHRDHEFMPSTLLDSQIDTLEPLAEWERGIVISIEQPPAAIVDEVTRILTTRAAGRPVVPEPGATITGAIALPGA